MTSNSMRSIACLLIVILAGCGGAARPSATRDSEAAASPSTAVQAGELVARPLGTVEGAPLGYLEYLPVGYGDGEPRPLLVFLHGSGEAGDGSERALEPVDALGIPLLMSYGAWPDDRPFVVLSPQYGTEAAEGDCDIAEDVASFLDFAIDRYQVDPSRVYLTGISCGAIGVWDYLAAHGDEVVAAAVPISGHAEWALEEAGCAPLTEVPVWAFHGAKDTIVPTVHIEGPIDQIRACDGSEPVEVELTIYADADHISAIDRTYDLSGGHDIYAWLLEHTRD
jgi:predicted peptidase